MTVTILKPYYKPYMPVVFQARGWCPLVGDESRLVTCKGALSNVEVQICQSCIDYPTFVRSQH